MEWKRVKTLLLVLLLVCDLGLGISLGAQYFAQRSREEQALTDALELLSRDGITVDRAQAEAVESGLEALLVVRDTEYEMTVAQQLLGTCTVTDQGGGVLIYASSRGTVTVRNGGYIEGTAGPEGFLTDPAEALGVESLEQQLFRGLELANTGLTRTETGFSGRWILADRGARLGTGGQRDRLLLDLAAFVGRDTVVTGLSQTWLVVGTAGRQVELEPVWRVETADSLRYMSLRTGRELTE